jgi:hypothetical protein
MLYATLQDHVLVVAAADSLAELHAFQGSAPERTDLFVSCEQPELEEMLTSPRFAGLTDWPLAPVFADDASVDAFREVFQIRIVEHSQLVDLQKAMSVPTATTYGGPVFTSAPGSDYEKTIGEITGLNVADRWDKRTDEQKLKDEVMKRLEDHFAQEAAEKKAAKAAGGPGKDIMGGAEGEEDETPEIPIDLDEVPEGLRARRSYYRMDVAGADIAAVDAHVEQTDTGFILSKTALAAEDVAADACWYAFARLPAVMHAVEALKDMADVVVTACSVHRRVQEGGFAKVAITIKDEAAADEIPARPWNAKGAEFATMTPEELEENRKGMKAEEFVIAGTERADGCVVHITPAAYFEEHGEPWPDALDIAHLLPPEYVETAPGTYFAKGKNYINVSFELCNRRQFGESLMLKAYLNGL